MRERSPLLPVPSNRDLETALRNGRFVVGTDASDAIAACATLVPLSSERSLNFVGELTGSFVDPRYRSGKPFGLQTLMLGLRLLHHAVLEGEAVPPATNTLITVVRHDNIRSLANVRRTGFVECDRLPRWLRFDLHSWTGGEDAAHWRFFRATDATLRRIAEVLVGHGLLTGRMRTVTATGAVEIALVGFRELDIGAADIREIAAGQYRVALAGLPETMTYPGDREVPPGRAS